MGGLAGILQGDHHQYQSVSPSHLLSNVRRRTCLHQYHPDSTLLVQPLPSKGRKICYRKRAQNQFCALFLQQMDDANFAPSFRRGGVKKVKGAKSILRPFFVANGRCQFCAHFPGKWAQNTFCAWAQGARRFLPKASFLSFIQCRTLRRRFYFQHSIVVSFFPYKAGDYLYYSPSAAVVAKQLFERRQCKNVSG